MAQFCEQMVKLRNGEMLTVRKGEPADAAPLLDYINRAGGESDYLTFGADQFGYDLIKEEQFLTNIGNSAFSLALVGTIEGAVAASATLFVPERPRMCHTSELGITVSRRYWGQGVGTTMLWMLQDFCRESEMVEIIHLEVREDNERAIALYRKMGFEEIGRFPRRLYVDGKYYDTLLMNWDIARS